MQVDPYIVARRRQLADGYGTRAELARSLGVTTRTLSAALSPNPGQTNARLYQLAILGLYHEERRRIPRYSDPGGPNELLPTAG